MFTSTASATHPRTRQHTPTPSTLHPITHSCFFQARSNTYIIQHAHTFSITHPYIDSIGRVHTPIHIFYCTRAHTHTRTRICSCTHPAHTLIFAHIHTFVRAAWYGYKSASHAAHTLGDRVFAVAEGQVPTNVRTYTRSCLHNMYVCSCHTHQEIECSQYQGQVRTLEQRTRNCTCNSKQPRKRSTRRDEGGNEEEEEEEEGGGEGGGGGVGGGGGGGGTKGLEMETWITNAVKAVCVSLPFLVRRQVVCYVYVCVYERGGVWGDIVCHEHLVCDMTRSNLWNSERLVGAVTVTHTLLFLFVVWWLICTCDIAHSSVWHGKRNIHDSFIRATPVYVLHDLCVCIYGYMTWAYALHDFSEWLLRDMMRDMSSLSCNVRDMTSL